MGLASSQARLLTLTSRQHAIEYKAQKLQAEKLQLANDSDQVYNTYLHNLDAKKIQYKQVDNSGAITFVDANFNALRAEKMLFKVGDRICNTYDQVVNALGEQYDINITAADSYSVLTSLVSEGYVVLIQEGDNLPEGYEYKQQEYSGNTYWRFDAVDANGENVYIRLDSHSAVGDFGIDGNTCFEQGSSEKVMDYFYNYFKDTSVSTSTKVQEVSDEVGLKRAEAQYEADMNYINRKDTQYDTQLSQLETERKAIKEEIDTLKTVAKENVDRTFKLFG